MLSMNRAAERAAPAAKPIFLEAITAMSFDDARKILTSSPTAATEYFKGKTSESCLRDAQVPWEHSSNRSQTFSFSALWGGQVDAGPAAHHHPAGDDPRRGH